MVDYTSRYFKIEKWYLNDESLKLFHKELSLALKNVIKLKVIKEKQTEKSYYIKASSSFDPDTLSHALASVMKFKANKSEMKSVQILLALHQKDSTFRTKELKALQKDLAREILLNRAKKTEMHLMKRKLESAKKEALKLRHEYAQIKKVVDEAIKQIKSQSKKACLIKVGMSKRKVLKAIGKPNTHNGPNQFGLSIYDAKITKWNYGSVSLEFTHSLMGTVKAIIGCQFKSKKREKK